MVGDAHFHQVVARAKVPERCPLGVGLGANQPVAILSVPGQGNEDARIHVEAVQDGQRVFRDRAHQLLRVRRFLVSIGTELSCSNQVRPQRHQRYHAKAMDSRFRCVGGRLRWRCDDLQNERGSPRNPALAVLSRPPRKEPIRAIDACLRSRAPISWRIAKTAIPSAPLPDVPVLVEWRWVRLSCSPLWAMPSPALRQPQLSADS